MAEILAGWGYKGLVREGGRNPMSQASFHVTWGYLGPFRDKPGCRLARFPRLPRRDRWARAWLKAGRTAVSIPQIPQVAGQQRLNPVSQIVDDSGFRD